MGDDIKKMKMGPLTIPLGGPFNMLVANAGIMWALGLTVLVFNIVDVKGPAIDGLYVTRGQPGDLLDCLAQPMIVTALWIFLYYNLTGVQAGTAFNLYCFELVKPEDVTDKYMSNAARFAGNMFEQSCAFLPGLWVYALFCDYATAGALGYMYLLVRLLYPAIYIHQGGFTMWFEFVTQPGLGVNGVFMLGIFVNGWYGLLHEGRGNEWAKYADSNNIVAPILGYFVGMGGMFPLMNPVSIMYGIMHYKFDSNRKKAQIAAGEAK